MEMPALLDEPMIQDMTNNSAKPNVLPSTANPRGVEQGTESDRVYYEGRVLALMNKIRTLFLSVYSG